MTKAPSYFLSKSKKKDENFFYIKGKQILINELVTNSLILDKYEDLETTICPIRTLIQHPEGGCIDICIVSERTLLELVTMDRVSVNEVHMKSSLLGLSGDKLLKIVVHRNIEIIGKIYNSIIPIEIPRLDRKDIYPEGESFESYWAEKTREENMVGQFNIGVSKHRKKRRRKPNKKVNKQQAVNEIITVIDSQKSNIVVNNSVKTFEAKHMTETSTSIVKTVKTAITPQELGSKLKIIENFNAVNHSIKKDLEDRLQAVSTNENTNRYIPLSNNENVNKIFEISLKEKEISKLLSDRIRKKLMNCTKRRDSNISKQYYYQSYNSDYTDYCIVPYYPLYGFTVEYLVIPRMNCYTATYSKTGGSYAGLYI